jgi:hypothetical protein
MKPTRAAWFFAVGIAWLVLRGIVGASIPALNPAAVARDGGWLLVIPLVSVLASVTIPVFFISFLRNHRFDNQRWLLTATVLGASASMLSLALVVVSFSAMVRRADPIFPSPEHAGFWLREAIPLLLVVAVLLFLVAFARQSRCPVGLRKAATVAAVGAVVPTAMMVLAMVHVSAPAAVPWFPGFGESPVPRILGLAAAAALVWFLETFAVSYGRDEPDGGVD